MKHIEVYHGSTEIVEHPLCNICRDFLDFGKGFYITDIRDQAIAWAKRISAQKDMQPILNVYSFDKENFMREAKCKVFDLYDREWLHFIVANRRGDNAAEQFDYIEGGVANDRVINTINFYMQGYFSEELALRRLAEHQPNNQICLKNQSLLDKYLSYEYSERP